MSPFKGWGLKVTGMVWHSIPCPFPSEKYLCEQCRTCKREIQHPCDTKLTSLPGILWQDNNTKKKVRVRLAVL